MMYFLLWFAWEIQLLCADPKYQDSAMNVKSFTRSDIFYNALQI